MRTSFKPVPRFLIAILSASLAACGGGSDVDTATSSASGSSQMLAGTVSTTTPPTSATTAAAPAAPTATIAPVAAVLISAPPATTLTTSAYVPQTRGMAQPAPDTTPVTSVQVTNTAVVAQSNASVTFGQAFAEGHVRTGETLSGKTASGATVALQVDAKARHADGSLRHAVITAQLPGSAPGQVETVNLVRSTATPAVTQMTPAALLNGGFTASFNATIGGAQYTASADKLLKSGKYTTWLSGSLVNEWLVSAPLKNAAGAEHPHLVARFAIRSYTGSNSARVDVTIENGWAYEAAPQNFTYDAQVVVGGAPVYTQAALTHFHHARWRKVFWWGKAPTLDVRHNTAYLIASKAVPNYDQSLSIREATIASWNTRWTTGLTGPMQHGVGMRSMGTTGARPDIGPMPTWNALYLLSMDQRMKNISLGMSELAGGWSSHYRNKNTDRPVTLVEYPYMTIIAKRSDTLNRTTRIEEAFPSCPSAVCTTPMKADTAHQPAFSYLPYLVTGDYYHLEELQFWANFNSFYGSPGYRQNSKGLVKADQVRGQAWSMRTLAEAAYITPDNDPQKAILTTIVNNNLDWYNSTYADNPAANKLGVLDHGSLSYAGGNGVAPWQDDFFTGMVGRMAELGFTGAQRLLTWKSQFVVGRMAGAGFCWIQAPLYGIKVRDSETSPLYTTMSQVYKANTLPVLNQLACGSSEMAALLGLKVGAMVGHVTSDGEHGIMQPALAYSANVHSNGKQAWAQYVSRPYKADFAAQPQYAIVPR